MTRHRDGTARTNAIAAVACASVLAVGVAACGNSSGGSQAATVAPASNAGSAGAPAAPSTSGSVPHYQPSSVVSKSGYSTVLSSPDSIEKIGAFYRDALAKGGWVVSSSSSSSYHASLSGHRGGEWVTVSVYPTGSGSGISISTSKPAG
jgi:hypothetical protein